MAFLTNVGRSALFYLDSCHIDLVLVTALSFHSVNNYHSSSVICDD